jgi:hypothetical protein
MFLAMSGMIWQIACTSPPFQRRKPATTRTDDWQELEHWHASEAEPRQPQLTGHKPVI